MSFRWLPLNCARRPLTEANERGAFLCVLCGFRHDAMPVPSNCFLRGCVRQQENPERPSSREQKQRVNAIVVKESFYAVSDILSRRCGLDTSIEGSCRSCIDRRSLETPSLMTINQQPHPVRLEGRRLGQFYSPVH